MRILIVLTYYRPHTSGLTIYAERLAKALAKRGHQVTVMTAQYEPSLAAEEVVEGVRIVRVPVLARISKGVIMPLFPFIASKLVLEHDVVQLHLPQFDAAWVAMMGRFFKKPTVITYHCDLLMPPGFLSWLANQGVRVMNHLAAVFTHRIVTYTRDYAENSSYLKRHMGKLDCILPPVELPAVSEEAIQAFGRRINPQQIHPIIGMGARFATEKGVEILLDALPDILKKHPDAKVAFAGPWQHIVGEEHYVARLLPKIKEYEAAGHWEFVGSLSPVEMSAFYPNIDILTIPSLNSTEAFGLVQIEAMINGVPSVASNLPGVRQPVRMHGMGRVVPIGDSKALAEAILAVLAEKSQYTADPQQIALQYQPESIAIEYEKLFARIKESLGNVEEAKI
jgi:glycosyltransferase involved in cell wall biosynthesis